MRDEVENMPGDFTPSKIVHDEKRLDRVLKENRALVMRCKELEIKLESRYVLPCEEKFVWVNADEIWNEPGTWSWDVRNWRSSLSPGTILCGLLSKYKTNMGKTGRGESLNPGMATAHGCRRRWRRTRSTSRVSGPSSTSCELTLADSRRPLTLWRTPR